MDEASSALDSETEQRLVDTIERLRQGRTTLIIAHRYSSIRSADRVVYFNGDGGITVGHHDELVKTHEGYQRAVQWQSGSAQ
jgi:ABC-type multidrug transport system fused ATPase/permease subunit